MPEFSLKIHQIQFSAGNPSQTPLWVLTALPQTPSWIWGKGKEMEKEGEEKGRIKRRGRRERWGGLEEGLVDYWLADYYYYYY